jgi:ferredoxin
MSHILRQKSIRSKVGIFEATIPNIIYHKPLSPSLCFCEDQQILMSCLGCIKPKCMFFSSKELQLEGREFSKFPYDQDNLVCPLNAITWEREKAAPSINRERCINCGICAKRCPVGAIYSNGSIAVIHSENENITFVPISRDSIKLHANQIKSFSAVQHQGQYLKVSSDNISILYNKLSKQQIGMQFSNIIIRNLLLVLGSRAAISRRGDVNFRIDGIAEDQETVAVLEVEFGNDFLGPPRSILDDIAVLNSRYGINIDKINPLIVFLEFPNIRTEYWRVIKDIRQVLGVKINSITFGALCALIWGFRQIGVGKIKSYADIDTPSISKAMTILNLGQELPIIEEFAVFKPLR